MRELSEKHQRPFGAAANAASAFYGETNWMLAGGVVSDIDVDEWLQFIIDNPTAPAESLYIKARALGLKADKPFADLAVNTRLAFHIFQQVFLVVASAIDRSEAEQAELAAFERAQANVPVARDLKDIPDHELEGTILERHPDPLAMVSTGAPSVSGVEAARVAEEQRLADEAAKGDPLPNPISKTKKNA